MNQRTLLFRFRPAVSRKKMAGRQNSKNLEEENLSI